MESCCRKVMCLRSTGRRKEVLSVERNELRPRCSDPASKAVYCVQTGLLGDLRGSDASRGRISVYTQTMRYAGNYVAAWCIYVTIIKLWKLKACSTHCSMWLRNSSEANSKSSDTFDMWMAPEFGRLKLDAIPAGDFGSIPNSVIVRALNMIKVMVNWRRRKDCSN